jgi:uncharacterized protein YkwD
LISIRSARLGSRASLASFSTQLRRHRAITRTAIAALSLAITTAVSAGGAAQAGLAPIHSVPPSILPVNVGVGIATDQAVALTFSHAMDRTSVEAALAIAPTHAVRFVWSDDGRSVKLVPEGLWATDARYGIVVDETARNDAGAVLGAPARFSFTTQTGPSITEFGLHFVAEPAGGAAALDVRAPDLAGPPPDTASGVSAETSIQITFSAPVRREEAENAFVLSPAVPGIFRWSGSTLTFVPIERFTSDARYAVTIVGVHDLNGNLLVGDASFSFTTRAGAQLVQTTPTAAATGVSATEIALWFSQPMDPDTAAAALRVTDGSSSAALTGLVAWNASHTQLRFTPARAFAGGHRFDVSLADGALDADGNAVAASLTFTTKAAVKRVTVPHAAASSTLVGYALNQVNAARQAYGLAPLVYSTAIEAVALAHAWDQITYGYFSHTGRDGSTHEDRLRRAGLVFGWNGENQCYSYNGATTTIGKLDWCQSEFMSEPYPGVANHIGNILSTHYTKVGIGIAISGAKVIIVWDFTD